MQVQGAEANHTMALAHLSNSGPFVTTMGVALVFAFVLALPVVLYELTRSRSAP